MPERRETPRLREENHVLIYLLSDSSHARKRRGIHVLGIDISTKGARCRIAEMLPVDTRLKMEIRLSRKAEPLYAVGNVRWTKKLDNCDLHEIGIEFDDRSPDFIAALQDYIEHRLESQSER